MSLQAAPDLVPRLLAAIAADLYFVSGPVLIWQMPLTLLKDLEALIAAVQ